MARRVQKLTDTARGRQKKLAIPASNVMNFIHKNTDIKFCYVLVCHAWVGYFN
jgi:hypothetical protein